MIRISSSCCTSESGGKNKSPYDMTIAFIGNPSVGKSVFFSRLTGVGVEVSNYPGTTVALKRGIVKARGKTIEVVDLPGIYSLGTTNEDEKVTKRFLIEDRPDIIVNVLDASRLERNLYLTLQLLELDIPMVIALNQVDLAADLGILVDADGLSELLGLPVVPTVATRGIGLDDVMLVALAEQGKTQEHHRVGYSQLIRQALSSLDYAFPNVPPSVKTAALLDDAEFVDLCCMPPEANALLSSARRLRKNLEMEHGISVPETVARDLYGEAGYIVDSVVSRFEPKKSLREKIDAILTSPNFGIAVLISALLLTFLLVFRVGGFLETWIVDEVFEPYVIQPAEAVTSDMPPILGNLIVYSLRGVEAGFAIAIPYIAVFYAILSIFEDSGYLTRAAFLLDNLAHKLGLHGRAVIPLVLGFGCNVPAIMAVHALGTRREKRIASVLISLVPCSARTVIILGLVGTFVGFWPAVSIYVLEMFIIVSLGWILGRSLPGQKSGFIMEMTPLRKPELKSTIKKTWMKSREFVYIAFPLLLIGSAFLGVVDALGLLSIFQDFVEPISVGLLGLPSFVVTALVFGILRKEMALQILAVLAGTANFAAILTPVQMYQFAVITTIYIPCVATIAVLKHELGTKDTALIVSFTTLLALGMGILIRVFGPSFL
ncbi:MAG: ferrous iron transport protein B [Methanosarcina flavescens]|uniref:Ferrous iron transport protein B n=1 Tax=Methanosarcina flavescens TaxID=1715806 RepID=A0A660HS14_9EURY|nr:ferrous iron transport protein B [Methanosarcina flavescens]AYK15012.1 ferrous iron transport protein B [Methanosarcina flavescens]NLK31580.1 ferrous iron transport protein B [Methanosarcina flavescens]